MGKLKFRFKIKDPCLRSHSCSLRPHVCHPTHALIHGNSLALAGGPPRAVTYHTSHSLLEPSGARLLSMPASTKPQSASPQASWLPPEFLEQCLLLPWRPQKQKYRFSKDPEVATVELGMVTGCCIWIRNVAPSVDPLRGGACLVGSGRSFTCSHRSCSNMPEWMEIPWTCEPK